MFSIVPSFYSAFWQFLDKITTWICQKSDSSWAHQKIISEALWLFDTKTLDKNLTLLPRWKFNKGRCTKRRKTPSLRTQIWKPNSSFFRENPAVLKHLKLPKMKNVCFPNTLTKTQNYINDIPAIRLSDTHSAENFKKLEPLH